MKWLAWIKGAANLATGGASSLYLYGGLFLAGSALTAAAWLWHGWQVDGAHDQAFQAGHAQVRSEVQAAETAALLEHKREISRLFGITQHWSKTNADHLAKIDDLERAAAADAGRLQRLTASRHAAVTGASDVAALRAYATVAGDVYESCRVEYRALGFDADRCAAAAHTLKGWADEVTDQRGPTQPNPPSRPTQP